MQFGTSFVFSYMISAYGEVYTWGWKECVPSGKLIGDQLTGGIPEKDDKQSGLLSDQGDVSTYLNLNQKKVALI